MRLAALGVNPEVVARWTLYRVTAMLSVAAVQLSDTVLPETPAVSPLGAVGGVPSAPITAVASFDAPLRFPAASSATTL